MYWISSSHADKEQKFSDGKILTTSIEVLMVSRLKFLKDHKFDWPWEGLKFKPFPYKKVNVG